MSLVQQGGGRHLVGRGDATTTQNIFDTAIALQLKKAHQHLDGLTRTSRPCRSDDVWQALITDGNPAGVQVWRAPLDRQMHYLQTHSKPRAASIAIYIEQKRA